jgi:hypothetical protein
MESKQTAVENLIDWMSKNQYFIGNDLLEVFEQAKAMEKEQIIDSFGIGCQVESTRLIGYQGMAEQYYNETYTNEINR